MSDYDFSFDCTAEVPYSPHALIEAVQAAGFTGIAATIEIRHDFISDRCENCGHPQRSDLLVFDRKRLLRR